MSKPATPALERVLAQLRLYEHPLLDFGATVKGEGVEVSIQLKHCTVPVHTYLFEMHPRDLDHPQFEWTFQRQLYDCLHVEDHRAFVADERLKLRRKRVELPNTR